MNLRSSIYASPSESGESSGLVHEMGWLLPARVFGRRDTVKYTLSEHTREEIERRRIPLTLLEAVLEKPDQIVPGRGPEKAYQSKRQIGGKIFLLRVIVDASVEPAVIVTAYRTTKIEKYWVKP